MILHYCISTRKRNETKWNRVRETTENDAVSWQWSAYMDMDTHTHTHTHIYSSAYKANPSGHSEKKINSKWFYMVGPRERASERKEKTKKRGLRKGGKTTVAVVAGDEDGQCVYINRIGCVLPVRFRNTRYEFGFSHPPTHPPIHPHTDTVSMHFHSNIIISFWLDWWYALHAHYTHTHPM